MVQVGGFRARFTSQLVQFGTSERVVANHFYLKSFDSDLNLGSAYRKSFDSDLNLGSALRKSFDSSRRKKTRRALMIRKTECDSMMLKTFYHTYILL